MKSIIKLSTFIILLCSFNIHAYDANNKCGFDENQIEVMRNAWFAGADRNYGWTLAAIAYKESSAGNNMVNWKGPAFGPFQNLLRTVANRQGVTTDRGKITLMYRLVEDFDFATEAALIELEYWRKRHKGDWNLAVQSYFGGNTPTTSKAIAYRKDITKKIKFLRTNECLFDE